MIIRFWNRRKAAAAYKERKAAYKEKEAAYKEKGVVPVEYRRKG